MFTVTEYRGTKAAKYPKVKNYEWSDFVLKLKHPVVKIGMTRATYDELPEDADDYDVDTKKSVKEKAGGVVFGEVTDNGRKAEMFKTRTAISLDYEHCKDDIYDRVTKALDGYTYLYHTTCKHKPPDDIRIHIIVPFNKPTDWKLFTVASVELARAIGLDGLDNTCLRRGQMMLYPVQLRGSEYRNYDNTGEYFDAEKFLNDKYGTLDVKELTVKANINWLELEVAEMYKYNEKKVTVKPVVKSSIVIPERIKPVSNYKPGDIKSCFNTAFGVCDILDTLREYIPFGINRYRYYKADGSPNVKVSDDGTKVKSYHSNSGDPLYNGHWNSALDVWLLYNVDDKLSWREKLQAAHRYALEKSERYKKIFYEVRIGW